MASREPERFKSKEEKRKFLRARSKERRLEKDALGNLRADTNEYHARKCPSTIRSITQGGLPQ